METADVVIIGGGIVGSSIAYHLTEAGCRNVLVIERETRQGKGSTGKSMGGVRAQFATPVNIRMSLYSIPFYAALRRAARISLRISAAGLSVRRHQRAHLEYLRANQERQKALGLKTARMVAARRDSRHVPATARRRHCGRQLLLDRRLRRSLQRDDRLHDAGLRSMARACGAMRR